jgi:hypothetical protein
MKTDVKVKEKDNVIVLILLAVLLFAPAFIQSLIDLGPHKQLIIGTIVNTALFLSSVYMRDIKKVIALSTLPSISNILTGILFSGLTYYSKLMLPFIWIGNLAIIYLSRILRKKMNYSVSGVISVLVKVCIIYGGFVIMSNIFNFPDKVVTVMGSAMGVTQLYTGMCGLIVSMIVLKIKDKNFKLLSR